MRIGDGFQVVMEFRQRGQRICIFGQRFAAKHFRVWCSADGDLLFVADECAVLPRHHAAIGMGDGLGDAILAWHQRRGNLGRRSQRLCRTHRSAAGCQTLLGNDDSQRIVRDDDRRFCHRDRRIAGRLRRNGNQHLASVDRFGDQRPAALLIAKVMEPETEPEKVSAEMHLSPPSDHVNVIGAAVEGASDGMKLALNVGAMLIAFLALLALIDVILGCRMLS